MIIYQVIGAIMVCCLIALGMIWIADQISKIRQLQKDGEQE